MAKKLNVDISFNADTANAKAQITDLQNSISKLVNSASKRSDFALNTDLRQAVISANELNRHITKAFNQNTGKLDFRKFNAEIQKSKGSLTDYVASLERLGPGGAEVFDKLYDAVLRSETPLVSLNNKVRELGTTLKNSVKWQLSSSAIHGFMGAVQGAMSYAQDLNRSLNDIRIVTGQSADDMARFAETANKAAQALSTTTTAYTKASLIYYQQGLNESEVKERTDTTIKLSNVTGESAEDVSSYMTAIWNNFDDGSKSLQYYADVITALGAATASSSEEIAGGLEKFAAVGNTIGLSYEYATSALATIVAQTRQSEDTVGTGLRTIFSRLQGLQQGETDEDGTDLNKYSKALSNVGINIKDTSGELKDMDQILNELGSKWGELGKAQQVALAQTVGGVRQWTNLVALMDNWSVFQENLSTAQNSEGSLEEQAKIYAESWEAAQKRVKASAQAIFQDIINDDFFIFLSNALAEILQIADKAIDSFGGLAGVLTLVGSIVTKVFSRDIVEGIKTTVDSVANFVSGGKLLQGKKEKALEELFSTSGDIYDTSVKEADQNKLNNAKNLMTVYSANSKYMNESQRESYLDKIKQQSHMDTEIENKALKASYYRDQINESGLTKEQQKVLKAYEDIYRAELRLKEAFENSPEDLEKAVEKYNEVVEKYTEGKDKFEFIDKETLKKIEGETLTERDEQIKDALVGMEEGELLALYRNKSEYNLDDKTIKLLRQELELRQQVNNEMRESHENATFLGKSIKGVYDNMDPSAGDAWSDLSGHLLAAVSGVVTLWNATKTLTDETASFGEKVMGAGVAIASTLPGAINAYKVLGTTQDSLIRKFLLKALAENTDTTAMKLNEKATLKLVLMQMKHIIVANKLIVALGAVALAVAAVALAVKYFSEKNSMEARLKKQQEETAALGKQANTTAQEISNLSSAWEELTNSASTLKSLKKDTIEWYESLAQTNSKIAEIIEKFPELRGAISFGENGQLILDDEKYEKVLKNRVKNQQVLLAAQQASVLKEELIKNEPKTTFTTEYQADSPITDKDRAIYGIKSQKTYDLTKTSYDENGNLTFDKSGLTEENWKKLEEAAKDYVETVASRKRAQENFRQSLTPIIEANLLQKDEYANLNDNLRSKITNMAAGYISNEDVQSSAKNAALSKYETEDDRIKEYATLMKIKENSDEYKEITDEIATNYLTQLEAINAINDKLGEQYNRASEIMNKGSISQTAHGNMLEFWQDSKNATFDQSTLTDSVYDYLKAASEGDKEKQKELNDQMEEKGAKSYLNAFKSFIEKEGNADKIADLVDANSRREIGQASGALAGSTGIDAERIQMIAEAKYEEAKALEESNDAAADSADIAAELAVRDIKLNEAIEDLYKNSDDYTEVLQTLKKEGKQAIALDKEMSATYSSLKKDVADLLDTSTDYITDDFMAEHMDKITEAANGSEEALKQLQKASEDEAFAQLKKEGFKIEDEAIEKLKNLEIGEIEDTAYLQSLVYAMQMAGYTQQQIEDRLGQMQIDVDLAPLNATLQEARDEAINTSDEIVKQMSFDASANTQKIEEKSEDVRPNYRVVTEADNVDITGSVLAFGTPDGTKEVTISVPAYSQTVEPIEDTKTESTSTKEITALGITKANKTYGGNISYKNSAAGRRAGSRRSGGSSRRAERRSGTKKGASSMKTVEKESDRYHVVKNQLEDITKQLDRISSAKDRAFGKSRLKLMDEEIKKQGELIEKQKQYVKEIEKNLSSDKKAIEAYGAKFDANGTIINYEEILRKAIGSSNSKYTAFNSEIDKYNKMSAEAQEKLDEQYKKKADKDGNFYSGYTDYLEKTYITSADENYEKFKETLDQYEETQKLYADESQTLIDEQRKEFDAKLGKVEYTIEIHLEVDEQQLEYLDYLMSNLENSSFTQAEQMVNLRKQVTNQSSMAVGYENGIRGIFANHGLTENDFNQYMAGNISTIASMQDEFTEAEKESLKEWTNGLLTVNENLKDINDSMNHMIENSMEEWLSDMDNLNSKLESGLTTLEHYTNIVGILGKEQLGVSTKDMATWRQVQVDQKQHLANSAREALSIAQTARDEAVKQYNEAVAKGYDEETLADFKEGMNNAESEYQSRLSNWQSAVEEALQSSVDAYTETVNDMIEEVSKPLEELQSKMEMQRGLDDLYLDETTKYYEMAKLSRDIEKSINDSDNLHTKQALAELEDEIAQKRAEGVEMSQYELDYLRKKYELELAEANLQDAQNAKSQVRMTRSNDGSWSYIYTADTDNIADAEQQYEDKLQEAYELTRDYIRQTEDLFAQTALDRLQALQELSEMHNLSEEERRKKADEINQYYDEKQRILSEEMTQALANQQETREVYEELYAQGNLDKIASDRNFVDSFNETTLAVVGNYQTLEQYNQLMKQDFDNLTTGIETAFSEMQAQNNETLTDAGIDVNDFAGEVETAYKNISDTSTSISEDIESTADEAKTAIEGISNAITNWQKEYQKVVDDTISKNEALVTSFNNLLAAWNGYSGTQKSNNNNNNNNSNDNKDSGTSGSGSGNTIGNQKIENGDSVVLRSSYATSAGGSYITNPTYGPGDKLFVQSIPGHGFTTKVNGTEWVHLGTNKAWSSKSAVGWVRKSDISGFDTGGYTGNWGTEGRLAMLHEKELVLNKDDTKNFLAAIQSVRQISQMIDINAAASSRGFTGAIGLGARNAQDTMKQTVYVTAEFPNATDKNEIFEAFENLSNLASQYINRGV